MKKPAKAQSLVRSDYADALRAALAEVVRAHVVEMAALIAAEAREVAIIRADRDALLVAQGTDQARGFFMALTWTGDKRGPLQRELALAIVRERFGVTLE